MSYNNIKKVGWGFGRCNQKCKHCYNNSKATGDIYTFSQLKNVADKICPFIEDINFGTGEFIFNPNTLDLAEYIKDKYPKIKMSVTSNGSTIVMMRPKKIKKIFNDVDVSLDFPDKIRHCEFRGHPRAWDLAMDSLKILKEENINHTIVSCITSQTTDEDISSLLKISKEYNASFRMNWFRCAGRGTNELRISAKRAWGIIEFLSEKVIFSCIDSIFAGVLGIKASSCPAGRESCRIHEDMQVSCYPFLKGDMWSAGNIMRKEIDLDTVYNSKIFKRIRNRKISFCRDCDFKNICKGGCVTMAYLHNGKIDEVDDYCPVKANLDIEKLKKIKIKFNPNKDFVHNGYLCTTICTANVCDSSKEYLNKNVKVIMDRPLNSLHPKYGFKYELNYGYIPDTISGDEEELDAYVLGVDKPIKEFEGKCVAIIHRLNDDDDKLIVIPKDMKNITDEKILAKTNFQEKYFKIEIIRPED